MAATRGRDLLAGLSVGGLMLPEAVAYAGIAGLPPARAILAGIAGCLAYAVFGRSRFAVVAPTSSSAAILAATLGTMPDATKAMAATVVVAFVGVFFLLAAALRAGGLTGFISRPVLRGFAFGLAVTIIVRQLPLLLGIKLPGSDIFHLGGAIIAAAPRWNLPSLGVGLAALAALLLARRFRTIPGAFLVLAAGIAASMGLDLPAHGVAVVGTIDARPSWPSLPVLSVKEYSELGQLTLALVLILFAESWGTMRGFALRHGDDVRADRELGALGLANVASALAQGMPVGAGFSAGAQAEAAGAASRATAVVAALALALLIGLGGGLVARLPDPVLAAVVIAAVGHSLDPKPFVRLWRVDRDQWIALGAAAAVLVLGVLDGMLAAVALSLVALLQRFAQPRLARLGRLGDSRDYVDVARHPDAAAPGSVVIWRPAAPLFFANAEQTLGAIAARSRAEPGVRALVVSLEETADLDSTALDALVEFDGHLRREGLRIQYARVHDHVRDLLTADAQADMVARCSYSVDDAVTAVEGAPRQAPQVEPN